MIRRIIVSTFAGLILGMHLSIVPAVFASSPWMPVVFAGVAVVAVLAWW